MERATSQQKNSRPPLIGLTAFHDTSGSCEGVAVQAQLDSYLQAIAGAGGAPVLVPLDLKESVLQVIFEQLDGLLLPGGVDLSPEHYGEAPHEKLGQVSGALDRAELALARWAVAADRPLLAICRGIQALNVALGGTLYQDIGAQLPGALEHDRFRSRGYAPEDEAHPVQIAPGSRLAAALEAETVMTNSRHHQAIKRLAAGLVAVAHTADGLVEGVEMPAARFIVGVQWHPENLVAHDQHMRRLFEVFLAQAGER